jgi:hypothetical protein
VSALTILESWVAVHDPPPALRSERIGRKVVAQVRGIVAERVVMSTELDPYLSLRALAGYSGISVRKLRDCLRDPAHPLPCYRLPGKKIVVRRSEYDAWAARHRQTGNPDLDRIAAEAVQDVRSGPPLRRRGRGRA